MRHRTLGDGVVPVSASRGPSRGGVGKIKRHLSGAAVALTSRDYRIFALGQGISVTGMWMQKLAQAWLVLALTNSGLLLGVTIALQQLPAMLLTMSGGRIADRFDRRRILIVTNIAAILPALTLGLVVWLGVTRLWIVMAAALVQGLADAIQKPSQMALVNDIVGPPLLANAIALNNIIEYSGKLLGPAIAGILIGSAGLAAAFCTNAASFVPVIIGLAMIRPAYLEERARNRQGSVKHTLRYVSGRRDLAVALFVSLVAGLFAFNFSLTLPLLFRDVLGGNAQQVGFGITCIGVGGVVGGLAFASKIRASARGNVVTAATFGFAVTLLAVSPNLLSGYVVAFVVGTTSVTFLATAASYIQLNADRNMRGRLMGFYVMANTGSGPIGALMLGGIAQLFGVRVSFLIGGIAMVAVAAVAHSQYRVAAALRPGGELARSRTAVEFAGVDEKKAAVGGPT